MEIFLTILKGAGIFALILPFALYVLIGVGGDAGSFSDDCKNSNWFIRIYMYYYPMVALCLLVIALLIMSFYLIGSDFNKA